MPSCKSKINHGKLALYGAGAKMTIKGGTRRSMKDMWYQFWKEWNMRDLRLQRWTGLMIMIRVFQEQRVRRISQETKSEELSDFMNLMSSPYRYPYGRAVLQEDVEKSETDTCIYVISRQAGEGADRKLNENRNTVWQR